MSGIVFSRVDIAGLFKVCQSFSFFHFYKLFCGMVRVQYSLVFDSTVFLIVFSKAEFFSAHLSLSFLVLPPLCYLGLEFYEKMLTTRSSWA